MNTYKQQQQQHTHTSNLVNKIHKTEEDCVCVCVCVREREQEKGSENMLCHVPIWWPVAVNFKLDMKQETTCIVCFHLDAKLEKMMHAVNLSDVKYKCIFLLHQCC